MAVIYKAKHIGLALGLFLLVAFGIFYSSTDSTPTITPYKPKAGDFNTPPVIPEGQGKIDRPQGVTTPYSTPEEDAVPEKQLGVDVAAEKPLYSDPATIKLTTEKSDSAKPDNADKSLAAGSSNTNGNTGYVPVSDAINAAEDNKFSDSKSSSSGPSQTFSGKVETKYVVVIDAGSTGSRVHVYEFEIGAAAPVLINETFKMLKPGLSSFKTDAEGAAKSLDPLLKIAVDTVPADLQGCTPVAVKATAGLRLLGKDLSDNILKAVRSRLENSFPFPVVEGDGISIMEGRDEGVYAWITANFLLGAIGSKDKTPTAAVFDLGGGSTQIVFEPTFNEAKKEAMAPGEHRYDLDFGGRKFVLYQYSHLGYGLMQGRNKIHQKVIETYLKDKEYSSSLIPITSSDDKIAKVTLTHACFSPEDSAENVEVKMENDDIYIVNFNGPETSLAPQCRFLAESVLNKELSCETEPCSFNGVHQPSLQRNFLRDNDMYIFSYFYDMTTPLGMPTSFTLEEMKDLANTVCKGDSTWKSAFSSIDGAVKQLEDEPHWCLDLNFMVSMLHTGYDIPLNRELKTAKTIKNRELGWCLGASLPLLDDKNGGWTCKVKSA